MAKIITKSWVEESTSHFLEYEYRDSPGSGFWFPCDSAGKLDLDGLLPEAIRNWKRCQTDPGIRFLGKRVLRDSYRHPAVLQCDCGCKVELLGFTSTCDGCNADYNGSGTRLAPRQQWGEETGEHWSECY